MLKTTRQKGILRNKYGYSNLTTDSLTLEEQKLLSKEEQPILLTTVESTTKPLEPLITTTVDGTVTDSQPIPETAYPEIGTSGEVQAVLADPATITEPSPIVVNNTIESTPAPISSGGGFGGGFGGGLGGGSKSKTATAPPKKKNYWLLIVLLGAGAYLTLKKK